MKPSFLPRSKRDRQRLFHRKIRVGIGFFCAIVLLSLIVLQRHIATQAQSNPPQVQIAGAIEGLSPQMLKNQQVGIQPRSYPVPAQAYFVAPDGNDRNSGTRANSPWTLRKALAEAPRGATIVLRGGIYRTGYRQANDAGGEVNETTIKTALTLQPYENEAVTLKGSLIATNWMPDGNVWKTTWLYHFPPGRNDVEEATAANPMAAHNDGVWIDGKPLWQVGVRDQVKPDTFYLDYDTNMLYIGINPTGKTVEATAFQLGLRSSQLKEPGVIIRGLTFMHYADAAVSIDSPSAVIENNLFQQNRRLGFFVGKIGMRFQPYGVDAIVRNNNFIENGSSGGGAVRGDRLVFENNWVKGNNTKLAKYSAAGVKFVRSDGIIVRHNVVDENQAVGIWFDGGATNATIVNNVIRRNAAGGVFWEISAQGIIAGNLLVDNNVGVRISGSTDARIYNNTFHNNGETTIRASDRDRRGQRGPGYIANTIVKNNIFSSIDDLKAKFFLIFKSEICEQPLASAIDYNVYYRPRPHAPQQIIEWEKYPYDASCPRQGGDFYNQLSDFQANTNFEQHGFELSGNPNPLFVDEANRNYALKPGSPAINTGEPLPDDIAEALGWETGTPVDLGAYQTPETSMDSV